MSDNHVTGAGTGGTVYGVGVGPGDPELLTLKALRLIREAPVLAYAAAEGVPSFARSIVEPHLEGLDAKVEIPMIMPMVAERFPAQEVYDQGAADIRDHLQAGRDVVVLCEGDPLFYGSFMYLFGRLDGAFPITVVPGVSSVMACAAAAGWPLVARNDAFRVLPATLEDDALRQQIDDAEGLAFMKVGRHLGRLKALLADAGLIDHAVYVERASLPNQRVVPLAALDEDRAPYFSMVLVHRRGGAHVL